MRGLIVSLIVNVLALLVVVKIVPGIHVDSNTTLIVAAIVIALVNTFIRPLVQLISLPLTLLTLGIFALVVNALMLELAALLVHGFTIESFWSALLGTIVLSLTSTLLNSFVKTPPLQQSNF